MRIAVASGKGGTGKTTVAVSLALTAAQKNNVTFVDCDVEAPNAHIFLKPDITSTHQAGIPVPLVDEPLCNGCKKCSDICEFSALAVIGKKVLVFSELCHGCGGCSLVCPVRAISERDREIGIIESGKAGKIKFFHAKLKIGEPMSPPLIRKLKAEAMNDRNNDTVILDCPPGTSCPVIESLKGADRCILVTEPTPFGLNDLELATRTVKEMDIPASVIINRAGIGDGKVKRFCEKTGLKVWMEIPHSRAVAEAYSRGVPLIEAMPEVKTKFNMLMENSL